MDVVVVLIVIVVVVVDMKPKRCEHQAARLPTNTQTHMHTCTHTPNKLWICVMRWDT